MALKGLDIFKLSPKKNCKECGSPTCMAFCMKVAQGAVALDKCPYFSEEAKAKLSEATAPPMKTITVGNDIKLGGETVLFRHEKTLVNRNRFAVPVDKCAVPFMAGRTADDLKGQKKWTTVSNRMLTHIIRSKLGWETAKTPRRFYGVPWPEQGAIIFDLTKIAPPRPRTPNLSAEDMLRAYELAESGSLLPVMAPAWSRQPFASVPPSEVIETQYVQVS